MIEFEFLKWLFHLDYLLDLGIFPVGSGWLQVVPLELDESPLRGKLSHATFTKIMSTSKMF